MPNLKLIHSEGVAFNAIDVEAARARGIAVCNCAGVNAGTVAEQAVMLMLMCLRRALEGDRAVREGRQIALKERMMVEGFRELGDCTVGFVGFGAIGQATARYLRPWAARCSTTSAIRSTRVSRTSWAFTSQTSMTCLPPATS